jgi:hypothetical protein
MFSWVWNVNLILMNQNQFIKKSILDIKAISNCYVTFL